MDKIGIFGNSNPQYIQDWVKAEIDESDQFQDADNDIGNQNVCNLPSTRVIEVFYSKINTFEQP